MAMEIEVNGHRVEVDDSFASLSPEAQQAQVNEIASMLPKPEQEVKAEEKATSELYSTPGVVAIGGAALGAVDQALGQPIESIAARKTGAQKIINPATGEHAGWKWARKTGFGAGLDPTVEGQSSEFQKRKAEGTFEKKPGQVKPIPGKALTLEKHMQNVARDELEAKLKAQAAARQAPGYTSTKPTTLTGKGLGLGGRMLAGAGALGMGKEAYDEGARALELAKSGDYGAAARAGRGALLNALGAAGSAATYVPHPLVRGLGTAVGLGAPALNLLLEKAGYAQGGLAHLSDGGKPPKIKSPKKMAVDLVVGRTPRVIEKIKQEAMPLWERFGYDPKKIAQQYPDTAPPILKPKETGGTFESKQLSPEALAVQKARQAAQKEITSGSAAYSPYFDITKRSYVDPTNYSMPDQTINLTLPKKAETLAKHQAIAQNPEATARLEGAFNAAVGSPKAHGFYQMKQLEDAFINELGPEAGRQAFRERFALPMAASTGGQTPNANLMMTAMHNYYANKGMPIPSRGVDLPYPVGGDKLQSNIDKSQQLFQTGALSAVDSPKRYNFASNFMGHADRPTIDEQMMRLFDPKGKASPAWYGVNEEAVNILAKKHGVDPVNFQEVAWAGGKGYEGQPMMEEINQMIHRTSRITGQSPEEVLRGFIRGNKPMYGITGLGALQAADGVNNPE